MKVAIVTPTIASDKLYKCIGSVQAQTYADIVHYVFIDGQDYSNKVKDTLWSFGGRKPVRTIQLEENVGKGWYGHRVYAACSFLTNADVICYLDEDNWFDIDHIESLVNIINNGNDWAYSLRKICDIDGNFICNDDCESLGMWPVFFDPSIFHIDTSSFMIKRDVATKIGHLWYHQWGADRIFFQGLREHFHKFNCNFKHSLNYRLEGNVGSVTHDFFVQGNKINKNRYNPLPWGRE
jgi:glycosyltransferase involved in cell wall biosynthesis